LKAMGDAPLQGRIHWNCFLYDTGPRFLNGISRIIRIWKKLLS
jgi:hypothetical protein